MKKLSSTGKVEGSPLLSVGLFLPTSLKFVSLTNAFSPYFVGFGRWVDFFALDLLLSLGRTEPRLHPRFALVCFDPTNVTLVDQI